MGRGTNNLTVNEIKNISVKGRYSDGGNLYLVVDQNLNKHWKFIYRYLDKRPEIGLGAYPITSLADARSKAAEYRTILSNNGNPKEHKAEKEILLKKPPKQIVTFKDCADSFIASYTPSLKNPKHIKQWSSTLLEYVYPVIGGVNITQIETSHVLQILEPIWYIKNPTATRVRGRIEKIIDSAKVEGHRTGENPARWTGHLALKLPHPSKVHEVAHFAALPYQKLTELYVKTQGDESNAAYALRFAILTAVRTGNARLATWDSIDFEQKLWTIEKKAMKIKDAEHRVPLSDEAILILRKMETVKVSNYIFPGTMLNKPINENALLNALRSLGVSKEEGSVHGFRTTLKVWGAETKEYADELTEMVLAHTVEGQTKQAYFRTTLFDKRRVVMNEWADFCLGNS
jgi:integrase